MESIKILFAATVYNFMYPRSKDCHCMYAPLGWNVMKIDYFVTMKIIL